ncbi:MAG: acyl-CoA dehydrogenase family protein [Silanimonas lenta]
MPSPAEFATHRVFNQPPPLQDFDAYASDPVLRQCVAAGGADGFAVALSAYGRLVGGELIALGEEANRNRPRFEPYDRFGHRIDEVHFHPAYHRLMATAYAHGVHSLSWESEAPGRHVARAALSYLHHQAEAGTSCPLTMTHAGIAVLRREPDLEPYWLARLTSRCYAPELAVPADKPGLGLGMGMTEKQGGSDVRANTTVAHPCGGAEVALVGHKWFFSAPMSDAFLVLAQEAAGLSCFLLPRVLPDGSRNALRLQRLKDKLGNWANASSEVEFQGAWARRIGEPGRGVATIIEMVALTRLDCMLGSAAEMRRAFIEALHHARHRQAFGRRLVDHALMQQVLADLALESEVATRLAFRIASAIDRAGNDPVEAALARIGTGIGKYWICRRAPAVVNEAQECLGGAGYIEESLLARLYREAPLNSIWEGCGNIQCLDVLRALAREPDAREALLAALGPQRGAHPAYAATLDGLERLLGLPPQELEVRARWLVERLALLWQAALLFEAGAPGAEAFCRSRLGGEGGRALGTLPAGLPLPGWLDAAFPA